MRARSAARNTGSLGTGERGPRYVVVGRPGPWLATIADRRTGVAELWSRSLRGGRGRQSRRGEPIFCAECGREIIGPFYRRSDRHPPRIRLCPPCVDGEG